MKEDSLVERLVYRLIKKHIAGTTMNSALDRAQEIDGHDILTSIMFLSGVADSKSKSRYTTSTYVELIRRISRLGLKSSVHIPIGQIGGGLDPELSTNNLAEIIAAGNKYGVFIWSGLNGDEYTNNAILERLSDLKGFGVAVPYENSNDVVKKWNVKAVKVMFEGKKQKSIEKNIKGIESISKEGRTTVLSSLPDNALKGMLSSKYKKSVIFEFGLGYGEKKVRKFASKGARTCISIPFGKDWTSYAMDIVPEGNMRFIVGNLLKEDGRQIA